MTPTTNGLEGRAALTPRPTIAAAMMLGVCAVMVFPVMPVLVGGLVRASGLNARQGGLVAAADVIGMATANALAFFWIRRSNWRYVAGLAIAALITGNLLCTQEFGFWPLLLTRGWTGMAEGTALALTYGILAQSTAPDRNYGLFLALNLTLGAITDLLSPTLIGHFGVQSLFLVLCGYPLLTLSLLAFVPAGPGLAPVNSTHHNLRPMLAPIAIALVANLVYFVGQSGAWAYFERLAVSQGLPLQAAANGIALSLLGGVAGAISASWLNIRLPRVVPLVLAVLLAAGGLAGLQLLPMSAFTFAAAAAVFNFGNNFGHPYLLGYLAALDPTARYAVVSGALQTGGMGIGPVIAAFLVTNTHFEASLQLGYASFALTLLLFVPIMILHTGNSRGS